MSRLTSSGRSDVSLIPLVLGLAVAALLLGALRIAERIQAERVGQQYVCELRRIIIEDALGPSRSPNIGITVARATNDLSAVRLWVSFGFSRIVAGIPLVLGVLLALFVLSPRVAAVLCLCLAVFAAYLYFLAPPAYERYRSMRRQRGRMASFVADAVRAAPSIYVAGGMQRELKKVDKLSEKVEDTAVAAAVAGGAMQGGASAIAMIMMVASTLAGYTGGLDPASLTTVLLLTSVLTGPVSDLGRVTELRQGFNAAHFVLRKLMDRRALPVTPAGKGAAVEGPSEVRIATQEDIPDLWAMPGARVVVNHQDRESFLPIRQTLLGIDNQSQVTIGSTPVDLSHDQTRRKTVGYVSSELEIEQGTLARAVRYRQPDSKAPIEPLLERLGLAELVASLPKAERTKLRRGGEPLSASARTRVLLARSLYETPPIVLLEDLSLRLSRQDLREIREVLGAYPGVVIAVDEDSDALFPEATRWDLQGEAPEVRATAVI